MFVPSWHEIKKVITVEIRLVHSQLFTSSHFCFLTVVVPATSQVLFQQPKRSFTRYDPSPWHCRPTQFVLDVNVVVSVGSSGPSSIFLNVHVCLMFLRSFELGVLTLNPCDHFILISVQAVDVKFLRIFYTVVESILNCVCGIWPVDYRLRKKLLIIVIYVWRRAGRTFKMLKVINGVIREDMWVTHNSGMNGR